MPTIYVTSPDETVAAELIQAQSTLDIHTRLGNGACTCGKSVQCKDFEQATATFARYGRLPRRRPFATITSERKFRWLAA